MAAGQIMQGALGPASTSPATDLPGPNHLDSSTC